MPRSDDIRQSISATLNEIDVAEYRFKQQNGLDIADPGEWMQLRDIVARIERRLATRMPAAAE